LSQIAAMISAKSRSDLATRAEKSGLRVKHCS